MLKHCTIAIAALIVNPRRHRLNRELTTSARQKTGVNGSETHVRVLGRIQVLRGAARHAARHECGAVIADWIRKNSNRTIVQSHSDCNFWIVGEK